MTQTIEALFDQGIERYKAGEEPETLIPIFQEICDRTRKNSSAWTCMAWLYLLSDQPKAALDAAQKAVKISPHDPQARVNLSIAMLETSKTGVRQQIEAVQQIILMSSELRDEVSQNIEDGLTRKPDWAALQRVKSWLFSS
ncbi:MAG: tetratricopeptide repeat protein [Leptolyngbyaceae cyanobacterium]